MQDKANNLSQPLQQQLAPFDMFMNSCSHEDYYNRGYPWKSGTGMVYSTALSLSWIWQVGQLPNKAIHVVPNINHLVLMI